MREKQKGEWYLPKSDVKLPGRLYVDEEQKKIILTLYTDVSLNGNSLFLDKRLGPSNDEDMYIPLILGGISIPITLYSCSWIGTSPISDKLVEFKYQIEFIFEFVHIPALDNLKFSLASIEYPNLESFYGDWNDMLGDEREKILREEYIDIVSEIEVESNKKIIIRDIKQKRIFGATTKDYKVTHHKDFSFEYIVPVDLNTIYKDCYTFLKILEFTSGKKLAFRIKNLGISLNDVSKSYDHMVFKNGKYEYPNYTTTYVTSSLDFEKEAFEDNSYWHQNFLLFSKWSESQEAIDCKIKKWFTNEKLMPIYDFYIDSRNWFRGKVIISNVMYNNKFLNLIQGLEAYYDYLNPPHKYTNEEFTRSRQEVINKLDGEQSLIYWVNNYSKFPKGKISLMDKLTFLCQKYDSILSPFFKDDIFIESYPNDAKELRHKLAHGSIAETYQGPFMDGLYKFSQLLLCICILESIEMPFNKIQNRLNTNLNWTRLIKSIKDRNKNFTRL